MGGLCRHGPHKCRSRKGTLLTASPGSSDILFPLTHLQTKRSWASGVWATAAGTRVPLAQRMGPSQGGRQAVGCRAKVRAQAPTACAEAHTWVSAPAHWMDPCSPRTPESVAPTLKGLKGAV